MTRCAHSVYRPAWLADGQPNPYCSVCSAPGPVPGERGDVHIGERVIFDPEALHANKRGDGRALHCKNCGSSTYYQLDAKRRECADCGTVRQGTAVKVDGREMYLTEEKEDTE